MKYLKWMALILVGILLVGGSVSLAEDDDCDHEWVSTGYRKATCTKDAKEYYECVICGRTTSKFRGSKLGHSWGEVKVITEATCSHSGSTEQKCSRCGAKRTVSIDPLPHTVDQWNILVQATDHSAGKRQGVCTVCNTPVIEEFDPEGTLRKGAEGEDIRELDSMLFCKGYLTKGQINDKFDSKTENAIKKLQRAEGFNEDGIAWPQTIGRLGHQYTDWNVKSIKSDFSIGEKERTCLLCGYTAIIMDAPSPMLKRKDKGDGVKALQEALNNAGYACGSIDGQFGGQTERAIKAFEKDHGMNEDGIAWPGVINMIPGIDITDCYAEHLYLIVSVTPEKEIYENGEKVNVEWTLATQSDADCKYWRIDYTPDTGSKTMMTEATLLLKANNNNSRSGKYELTVQADSANPETCSVDYRAVGIGSDGLMLRSEDVQVQLKVASN